MATLKKGIARPFFSDSTFTIDGQQRVVAWGPSMEGITGLSSAQAVGQPCYDIFRGRDPFGRPFCCRGCIPFTSLRQGRLARRCSLKAYSSEKEAITISCELVALPPGAGACALALVTPKHLEQSHQAAH